MPRLLPLLLSLVVLVAACDGGETPTGDAEDTDVDTSEPGTDDGDTEEAQAGESSDAEATFVSPVDGDVLQPTFGVQMEATGTEIVPADDPAPGQAHFHIVVDAGCVAEGDLIPGPGDEAQAEGYYHYGDGASETELELEPGSYELCLQLGDGEHRAFGGTDVITVTVVAGRG